MSISNFAVGLVELLILIRKVDIQNSVTVANYSYYRSVSWFSAGIHDKLFYIVWNVTANSFTFFSTQLPASKNSLKFVACNILATQYVSHIYC